MFGCRCPGGLSLSCGSHNVELGRRFLELGCSFRGVLSLILVKMTRSFGTNANPTPISRITG